MFPAELIGAPLLFFSILRRKGRRSQKFVREYLPWSLLGQLLKVDHSNNERAVGQPFH
jgi:hypothetical protein